MDSRLCFQEALPKPPHVNGLPHELLPVMVSMQPVETVGGGHTHWLQTTHLKKLDVMWSPLSPYPLAANSRLVQMQKLSRT